MLSIQSTWSHDTGSSRNIFSQWNYYWKICACVRWIKLYQLSGNVARRLLKLLNEHLLQTIKRKLFLILIFSNMILAPRILRRVQRGDLRAGHLRPAQRQHHAQEVGPPLPHRLWQVPRRRTKVRGHQVSPCFFFLGLFFYHF